MLRILEVLIPLWQRNYKHLLQVVHFFSSITQQAKYLLADLFVLGYDRFSHSSHFLLAKDITPSAFLAISTVSE